MNSKTYQQEVKRSLANLGSDFYDQLHMVIGVSTEAGELLDQYKKGFAYGKKLDKVNIVEELGDLLWYIANMCNILGVDLEKVFEINVEKLKSRYPDKFMQDAANNRDIEKERVLLEEAVQSIENKGLGNNGF